MIALACPPSKNFFMWLTLRAFWASEPPLYILYILCKFLWADRGNLGPQAFLGSSEDGFLWKHYKYCILEAAQYLTCLEISKHILCKSPIFCVLFWLTRMRCHSFCIPFHLAFYVWIRTQRAALASRRAINLATHLPNIDAHPPLLRRPIRGGVTV